MRPNDSRIFTVVCNIAVLIIVYLYVDNKPKVDTSLSIPQNAPDPYKSRAIVIYNRIPKTGSTTLTNAIGYDLCRDNGFNAIHLNLTKNKFSMNLADQADFVQNVTTWTEKLPAFYHGHVAFVDFTRFGRPNPIYINLIREPLERLLSHYYFLRYGDNFRVGLKRSKAGNNETFDECITKGGKDCDMKSLWLTIPYFCGTASFCSTPGDPSALAQAKHNLVNHYLVVGVTERMADLITVLDRLFPSFFKGAAAHYKQLGEDRAHLRYTNKKIPPKPTTIAKVQANPIYKMEREFYDFAKTEFESLWNRIFDENGNPLPSQFHYEKIKP
uniref:Sulfotransfer_1 domain-containing protein n=1 Tax=Panagrellus redivivus TaxID=6233 RepID=A0A7E4VNK9_PANRE